MQDLHWMEGVCLKDLVEAQEVTAAQDPALAEALATGAASQRL